MLVKYIQFSSRCGVHKYIFFYLSLSVGWLHCQLGGSTLLLLMFCWVVGVVAALLLPPAWLTCTSLVFSVSATVVPLDRLVLLVLAAGYNSAAIFCFFLLVRDRVRIS